VNTIERKQYWNRTFTYSMCRSVGLSVGLSVRKVYCEKRVIKSGCRLGGKWVGRGTVVLNGGSHVLKGRKGFGGFRFHWFELRIFNRNIFDSCVKSLEYFRSDNASLETSVYRPSKEIVRCEIEAGVYEKYAKM